MHTQTHTHIHAHTHMHQKIPKINCSRDHPTQRSGTSFPSIIFRSRAFNIYLRNCRYWTIEWARCAKQAPLSHFDWFVFEFMFPVNVIFIWLQFFFLSQCEHVRSFILLSLHFLCSILSVNFYALCTFAIPTISIWFIQNWYIYHMTLTLRQSDSRKNFNFRNSFFFYNSMSTKTTQKIKRKFAVDKNSLCAKLHNIVFSKMRERERNR